MRKKSSDDGDKLKEFIAYANTQLQDVEKHLSGDEEEDKQNK